jgi:Nif-specific regulatory protein
VRIVAATNRNLDTVVGDGTFRADLLYRVNGFQISLTPLRERTEDIDPLATHILKQLGGAHPPDLTDEALEALRTYDWPGNVRQLRNCLERALLLSNEGRITLNELPPEVMRRSARPVPVMVTSTTTMQPTGEGVTASGADASGQTPASLREVERQQILAALEQTGWHRGKTAEILGISPSTLYRRLRDYNLDRRN